MGEAGDDGPEVVLAGYRARASDLAMIRWITPAVILGMIVFGIFAQNPIALIVFLGGAAVIALRWVWVTMIGPRPLATEIALTEKDLRIKTLRGTTIVAPGHARSLMPSGLRARPRGPRSLLTTAGTFTLYPDAPGYDELVGALVGSGDLRVEDSTERTHGSTPSPGPLATARSDAETAPSSPSPGSSAPERAGPAGAHADLAPGIVAIATVATEALADQAVAKLEAAGITALALPPVSGMGGVRVTVQQADRDRAETILRAHDGSV